MNLLCLPSARRLLELLVLLALVTAAPAYEPVHLDGYTVTYRNPDASQVRLAAEFTDWHSLPMANLRPGLWQSTHFVEPGQYAYKLVVDDQWILDPNNPEHVTRDGIQNSLAVVGPVESSEAEIPVSFSYQDPTAQSVHLVGSFNQWNTEAHPFVRSDDGSWALSIPLSPGTHTYKLLVDGNWILDPTNPDQVDDGTGNMNSVRTVKAAVAEPAEREAPYHVGGNPVFPHAVNTFLLPGHPTAWKQADEFADDQDINLPPLPEQPVIETALVLPHRFDPSQTWPILIVQEQHNAANVGRLQRCYKHAASAGCVVLAAEGYGTRYAQTASALEALHTEWPQSRTWPLMVAGHGDGARESSYLAAMLVEADYPVTGLWLFGCTDDHLHVGQRTFGPSASKLRKLALYLVAGTHDPTCNPETQDYAADKLRRAGYKNMTVTTFDGGDKPFPVQQLLEGLQWIRQEGR